jgi:hypothetical protein
MELRQGWVLLKRRLDTAKPIDVQDKITMLHTHDGVKKSLFY